ncbi:Ribosome biogenesis protein bms1 [Porphyridium purpureum]|uniref:Ribosome biogenesis protein bms1 n=1 Tax=Porphyridium purpureum TaxID=35688 RepID=A0A5J4YM69_PORPP|nr:Ribosome biogenesis protein bms1 [Porphyridium purpureum]|eukprot:POR9717..scf295_9
MERGAVHAHAAHRAPSGTSRKVKGASALASDAKQDAAAGTPQPAKTGKDKSTHAKPGSLMRRARIGLERDERRAKHAQSVVVAQRGAAAAAADGKLAMYSRAPPAPPRLVAVVGPPKSGKSTIIKALVGHYTKRRLRTVDAPITVVCGASSTSKLAKRITFIEVGSDINSMLDVAKVADVVMLTINASIGFEMETFEFLNMAQNVGMPKILGILTHLDLLSDGKQMRAAKKTLKQRFWTELYDGAKLFYLSGITTKGEYLNREVLNLARFLSVSKPRVVTWRATRSYLLADRIEDVTSVSPLSSEADVQRGKAVAAVFGYLRGPHLRPENGQWRVHVPGLGDMVASSVAVLPDPCALDEDLDDTTNVAKPPKSGIGADVAGDRGDEDDAEVQKKAATRRRRKVGMRERMLYAPMASDVDGVAYDKDAVYIHLPDGAVRFSSVAEASGAAAGDALPKPKSEGEAMVRELQRPDGGMMDRVLDERSFRLTEDADPWLDVANSDSSTSNHSSAEEFKPKLGSSSSSSRTAEEEGQESSSESEEDGNARQGEGAEESDALDSDPEAAAFTRWREIGKRRALERNEKHAIPMQRLVYGDPAILATATSKEGTVAPDPKKQLGLLFEKRRHEQDAADADGLDKTKPRVEPDSEVFHRWEDVSMRAFLRATRFATGQQQQKRLLREKAAGEAANNSDSDSDASDLYGDFEDLEEEKDGKRDTGVLASGSDSSEEGTEYSQDSESDDDIDRRATADDDLGNNGGADLDLDAYHKKKERTRLEFEERGSKKRGEHPMRGLGMGGDIDGEGVTPEAATTADEFLKLRAERDRDRELELLDMDEEMRTAMQGISPGAYIRVELAGVAREFIDYFDPRFPLVLGGLTVGEAAGSDTLAAHAENASYVKCRIKRHRWKRGVLKSHDAIFVSVGWRRLQVTPVYCMDDEYTAQPRSRFLKYTPEYMHCQAVFYAPRCLPGTAVIMFATLGRNSAAFRISATGVVTECSPEFRIMKKLKLVGEPYEIHKNSAFIKGMFNSEMEVNKFIGAGLRTVSGIRGSVKKAVPVRGTSVGRSPGDTGENGKSPGNDSQRRQQHTGLAGAFRATFEDRLLRSDLVFLRAWVPVDKGNFCVTATNLLEPVEQRAAGLVTAKWRMKTVRELRVEHEVPIPLNKDSLYRDIDERPAFRQFNPLKIPKRLQAELPFSSRVQQFVPKRAVKRSGTEWEAMKRERAVVMNDQEKKEYTLMQMVNTIRKSRERKAKAVRKVQHAKREKKRREDEEMHRKGEAKRRKIGYVKTGLREKAQARREGRED